MYATPIEAPKDFRKAFSRFIRYFGIYRSLIVTVTVFIAAGTLLRTLGPALIGNAIKQDLELSKNLSDFVSRMEIVLATIVGAWISDVFSGILLTRRVPLACRFLRPYPDPLDGFFRQTGHRRFHQPDDKRH